MTFKLHPHERVVSQEHFGTYMEILVLGMSRDNFQLRVYRYNSEEVLITNNIILLKKYELQTFWNFEDYKATYILKYSKGVEMRFFQTKNTRLIVNYLDDIVDSFLLNKKSLLNLKAYVELVNPTLFKTIQGSSLEDTKKIVLDNEKRYKKEVNKEFVVTKNLPQTITKLEKQLEEINNNPDFKQFRQTFGLFEKYIVIQKKLDTLKLEKKVLFSKEK